MKHVFTMSPRYYIHSDVFGRLISSTRQKCVTRRGRVKPSTAQLFTTIILLAFVHDLRTTSSINSIILKPTKSWRNGPRYYVVMLSTYSNIQSLTLVCYPSRKCQSEVYKTRNRTSNIFPLLSLTLKIVVSHAGGVPHYLMILPLSIMQQLY